MRHALVLQPVPPAHARHSEPILPVAPAREREIERVDGAAALGL